MEPKSAKLPHMAHDITNGSIGMEDKSPQLEAAWTLPTVCEGDDLFENMSSMWQSIGHIRQMSESKVFSEEKKEMNKPYQESSFKRRKGQLVN